MQRLPGTDALIAKRTDEPPVDTAEIRALTEAAGHEVTGELTQVRPEDAGTYFGRGKVAEIADRVTETGATVLVVDAQLTPTQSVALREALPDGTDVFDRYRLILAIFADQAESRRAQLQVELARLRYALPRLRERSDVQALNKYVEKGTPIDGVQNRIADLERKLADLPSPAEQYRERRREQGFDLVTLAGYTNAGKSTLLHRIADEMALDDGEADSGDERGDRPPADPTAAVEDRLFKTLETTTRRATLDGRPTLVTDTVGFVEDLPHWLVESFSETLSEAAAADVVVLVVDASDDPETMAEKLDVSLDVLRAQSVDDDSLVVALNKVDLLDADERIARRAVAEERLSAGAGSQSNADGPPPTVVPVSVTAGTNVDALVDQVTERLPTDRLDLSIPNCDEAMALVSRAYDEASVERVEYDGGNVELAVRGRPDVLARLADAATEVAA